MNYTKFYFLFRIKKSMGAIHLVKYIKVSSVIFIKVLNVLGMMHLVLFVSIYKLFQKAEPGYEFSM